MTRSPGGVLLRAGLELGDAIVGRLPTGLAYWLADLLGAAWYRFAPERRRLVAANLARVAEHGGRPLPRGALRRQVQAAFVAHARYYLEVVRMPRLGTADVDRLLDWRDEADIEALARKGGVIGVSAHFGNFEPAAIWIASRGLRWVAPVERIEPPALFDYLRSRRGAKGQGGELVAAPGSGRRAIQALKRGELVAIAADREVEGNSVVVDFFGHPARIPSGPATLALLTGASIVVGMLPRVGPERFVARIEPVPWTTTGDRRADIQRITQDITDRLAAGIAQAPEQWWGSFQPIWDDIRPEEEAR
jgi:KDO2-lipid IV(A) lauroyltransferase